MEWMRPRRRRIGDDLDDDDVNHDDDRDDDHDDDDDDHRGADDDDVKGETMSPGRIFDIVAIICFAISAVPWPPVPPVNLMGLGLVFFTLGHLFP